MEQRDVAFICLAQQNGITAVSLGLLLEETVPNAVTTVVLSIVVVNCLHAIANRFRAQWGVAAT
jgi:hypothetical protein